MGSANRRQENRIDLQELIAATGTNERDLVEWRSRGLFPFEAEQEHIPGRRGSASFLKLEAMTFLKRFAELREQRRSADEWIWQLWLDRADYEIDIRRWVLERLAWRQKTVEAVRAAGKPTTSSAEVAVLKKFGLTRHVRNPRARRLILDWLVAWLFDEERPDIYAATPEGMAEPSNFELMLKSLGFPTNAPIIKGKIADRGAPYWIARLQRIVSLAQDREIAQARQDWRTIQDLVKLAETRDWNKVPPLVLPNAKSEYPSWATRKTRRARPRPAPDLIQWALIFWKNFDGRALVFCVLLIARRLFSRSPFPELPDQWAGIARQWLAGLPEMKNEQ